jgi:hypothetical protein
MTTNTTNTTTFGNIPVGSLFTIPVSYFKGITFMKVSPRLGGKRPNKPHMEFKGVYNCISSRGARWVWNDSKEVVLK